MLVGKTIQQRLRSAQAFAAGRDKVHARNFKYHIDMGRPQELMMLIEVSLVVNGEHGRLTVRIGKNWFKNGPTRLIKGRPACNAKSSVSLWASVWVGLITAMAATRTMTTAMMMITIINNAPAIKGILVAVAPRGALPLTDPPSRTKRWAVLICARHRLLFWATLS